MPARIAGKPSASLSHCDLEASSDLQRSYNMPPPPPPASTAGPPPDYMENGRMYHGYRKGTYMYPCDEVSAGRIALRGHIPVGHDIATLY